MFRHGYRADNVEPSRSIRFSSKQHSILSIVYLERKNRRKEKVCRQRHALSSYECRQIFLFL